MFAMRWRRFVFFLVILLLPSRLVSSQEEEIDLVVISPADEDVIFGISPIIVQVNHPGLVRYEISFTYADDDRGTWFPVTSGENLEEGQIQYEWDTNQITDGNYDLRILTSFEDGSQSILAIRTVRIRNYTQVETPTAALETLEMIAALSMTPTETATPTYTPTPWRTPTPLPQNPVEITNTEFRNNLALGAVITLGGLSVIGIYTWLRRRINP